MAERVAGVILDRADLLEVARLIRAAERYRLANGLPASTPKTATLKSQVIAALADSRTANGQQSKAFRQSWISTAEYATRLGCSTRTARRHAQTHGARRGGRWYIPIQGE